MLRGSFHLPKKDGIMEEIVNENLVMYKSKNS